MVMCDSDVEKLAQRREEKKKKQDDLERRKKRDDELREGQDRNRET